MPIYFRIAPLRLEFIAKETIQFPSGKAANTLRGALGMHLEPHVFAPRSQGRRPSGLADPPRPFVFRVRHLDGATFERGDCFSVHLNVFTTKQPVLAPLIEAFGAMAREGLGPTRGKAELQQVPVIEPLCLDLSTQVSLVPNIRVEFLSPTELKHEHGIAERPEFPILFSRIRDRISTLRALYGEGPLAIDFAAAAERAAAVQMTRCDLRRIEAVRHSSRTGQNHSIGGFTGIAEYEGDLAEFKPYLEAAEWTGVGRQCVWGKGELRISGPRY